MKVHTLGGSEVAALHRRLEQQYAVMRFGLASLAQGTTRHTWITTILAVLQKSVTKAI